MVQRTKKSSGRLRRCTGEASPCFGNLLKLKNFAGTKSSTQLSQMAKDDDSGDLAYTDLLQVLRLSQERCFPSPAQSFARPAAEAHSTNKATFVQLWCGQPRKDKTINNYNSKNSELISHELFMGFVLLLSVASQARSAAQEHKSASRNSPGWDALLNPH